MIEYSDIREEQVSDIARKMIIAAKTAPKARAVDNMVYAIPNKEEVKLIANRMIEIDEEENFPAFSRDAQNILKSDAVVLLGTKIGSLNLKKCGMCGFKNCEEKNKYPEKPCVFNTGDLGIAVGSAVSIAADNRIDNRIMYTAGQAVLDLKLFGDDVKVVYAIPLSAERKNIFFDRKT